MKKLLTIVMVVEAVLTIEATQPTQAAIMQPIVSNTDQSQVRTALWFR